MRSHADHGPVPTQLEAASSSLNSQLVKHQKQDSGDCTRCIDTIIYPQLDKLEEDLRKIVKICSCSGSWLWKSFSEEPEISKW